MLRQIKDEIVINKIATLPTITALARDEIYCSRQYELMCEAMYDTVIEYETELKENNN